MSLRRIPAHAQQSPPPQSLAGVIDAALDVAKRRRKILDEMKAAILENDNERTIACAKQLCGFDDEHTY